MMLPGNDVPAPKVRVLVADDAEVIVSTLVAILDLAGYEACAVYGGAATRRVLDLFKPDLIVTDVTAASFTGVEISSSLPYHLPRCRILLFLGPINLHSLLCDASEEGLSFEVLTRPIQEHDLLLQLRQHLCSESPPLLMPIDMADAAVH